MVPWSSSTETLDKQLPATTYLDWSHCWKSLGLQRRCCTGPLELSIEALEQQVARANVAFLGILLYWGSHRLHEEEMSRKQGKSKEPIDEGTPTKGPCCQICSRRLYCNLAAHAA